MKTTTRARHRLRQRRLTLLATFVALFVLASGGVAMAATGFAHLLKSARHAAPQAPDTFTAVPGSWQPPGCAFPGADEFRHR